MSSNRRWWWVGWLLASALAACATGSTLDGELGGGRGGSSSDAGHGRDGAASTGNDGAAGSDGGGAGAGNAGAGYDGGADGSGASGSGGGGHGGSGGGSGAGGAGGGGAGQGGNGGSAGAGTGGASGSTDAGAGGSGGVGGETDAGLVVGDGGCTAPVSGPCDTFPQCGCDDGESCRVTGTAGETSCSVAGSIPAHHACDKSTDCEVGYACVTGSCKPFCNVDDDCGGNHKVCIQLGLPADDGTTTPVPHYKVCSAQCDLVNPTALCGAGSTCVPRTATGPSTDCLAGAGKLKGEGTCSKDQRTCAPGYTCVLLPDFFFGDYENCSKWCRIGSAYTSDCSGTGGSCARFDKPIKIDGVEYGFCY